ncbi:hypothetical protein N7G274_006292 [Stereocaulon virgatum]|uniref:F-box domain-containing protein n=1 Tax=Stereocaulon virgatum TaxID=373712 RepID=A0ABR4A7W5_9LECA
MASYEALFSQLTTPNLKMDPSYKVDEGYSEDTRSQDGFESPMSIEPGSYGALASQMGSGSVLLSDLMALSETERSEFAYKILRTLRVSSIASVVDRLWPCFHKDPIQILPPEIMSQIFSYLTPSMLLEASRASKTWRERVLDSRLWKHKFRTEGWSLDMEEIERYEQTRGASGSGSRLSLVAQGKQRGPGIGKGGMPARLNSIRSPQSARMRHKTYWPRPEQSRTRIKVEEDPGETRPNLEGCETTLGNSREGESEDQQAPGDDHDMRDAGTLSPVSDAQSPSESCEGRRVSEFLQAKEAQLRSEKLMPDTQQPKTPDKQCNIKAERALSEKQPLLLSPSSDRPRLNYHHVFKQKRKLEDNWNNGQYRCFQLPHRKHPEDAHTECVYTIQYSGQYLVSGSRDRTLRIWDLDTERLVREPLHGHTGSVLCLQFDHSQEEDIIISGSSDTHVILWRFSTGRMIKQLTNAHRESVLNLKFDKRFLVTCSKDKTIKIWNRHELRPGDRNYPVKGVSGGGQCPAYIIDMHSIGSSLRNEQFSFSDVVLEPYTHLMTLDLHGAAVNAIQIYKDELVSASGDRNLRVWNIHTGECATKIEAHKKGIACVQYDGKRIVSGSSDNNICIWDPITKTEVARLEGHSRLVRTIQAAFADYPGGRNGLGAEADVVNRQWKAASIAGLIPAPTSAGRQPRVVPGSRKPRDIRSVGAKIPPSGGGSKWGRIVSGSYDETIIIWKKTADDEWVIGHRLRQEEALRAAGPPLIPRSDLQNQTDANTRINQTLTQHDYVPNQVNIQQATQAQPTTSQPQPQTAQVTNQGNQNPAPPSNQPHPLFGNGGYQATPIDWPPPLAPPFTQQRQQQQQQQQQQPQQNTQPPTQPQHPPPPPQPHHAPPRPPHPAAAQVGQPNARVFKLQFDARRIICCSQDPKIVGWDFANGDEEIIECSRFFAAPQ